MEEVKKVFDGVECHFVRYRKGLIEASCEQIIDLHESLVNFQKRSSQEESGQQIMVLLLHLPLSKHWVSFVIHSPDKKNLSKRKLEKVESGVSLTKIYYLDSLNISHLGKPASMVPNLVMTRLKEKIKLGLKATDRDLVSNAIQTMFDIRAFMCKLVHIVNTPQKHIGAPAILVP